MTTNVKPKIEPSWFEVLQNEFNAAYFQELKQFLVDEKQAYTVYPPGSEIFAAYDNTPFDNVKVVILGQDPYHGPKQAHGLCFSVRKGVKPPPSLKNIFKEMNQDLGLPIPNHGDLTAWAQQGVLLLNATLTVRRSSPASHQKKGWEQFTDASIKALNEKREGLVFLLWGKSAQQKADLIDESKHHILKAPHPSPYSANYGFFGCKHFSKTNEILNRQNKTPINWSLA